ncbi:hypothetical protein [Leptospira alstonii]|uniref:hypothetical protein n=1 Tax=Leptospira alstonii TaxID=28452 RepID=UPI000686B3F8|nr:hypothetical protein [Leptospira alstonii]
MKNRRSFTSTWDELDYLYVKVLRWFYGSPPNRAKARVFADRLENLLDRMKPEPMAIKVEECRAIVCEVKGDLIGAIHHRCREIDFLKTLFSLPEYPKLAMVGDHSDLVDRLILLAILYKNIGSFRQAIDCLEEAKVVAKRKRFRFPAKDLLSDLRWNSAAVQKS